MISFWFLSDCPLSVLWLLSDCSLIALWLLSVFSLFSLCFLSKCSLSVQAFKIIFYFVGWNIFCWMLFSGYIANYFDGNYRNITFYFPTKASQNNTLLSKLILPKQKRVKEGHKSCECRFLFTTLPNIYSPHISVKCGVSTITVELELSEPKHLRVKEMLLMLLYKIIFWFITLNSKL